MKFLKSLNTILFFFISVNVITGCATHSIQKSPVTSPSAYPRVLEQAKKDKRYFIMRSGVNIYTVVSVQIDKKKENMTVQLDKVDSAHLSYNKLTDTIGTTPGKDRPRNFSTVQVYMKDSTSYTLDEPHTIPLVKVARIELEN